MPVQRPKVAADSVVPELEPPINILEWLTGEGAGQPRLTKSVPVYLKPYLAEQLNELADRIEAAEGRERSMSDASPAKLTRQWEELKKEFDHSRVVVKVRARVPGDFESLRAQMTEDARSPRDQEWVGYYTTARLMVDPVLTPEQVKDFAERIGSAQYDEIVLAWNELGSTLPQVTVPKSLRG